MNTKRCQICWTGTVRGEFMAIPMCGVYVPPIRDRP